MSGADRGRSDLGHLMQLAQAGDDSAYFRLLKDITPIIRAAVRRRLPRSQPADLEDVVQDVLVSVHAVRATYDPARPFLPWLLTITHNRAIDRFRKMSRIGVNETNVGEMLETFPQQPTNLSAEGYGDEEFLQREIAALPASQRRAIELLKIKELSLKEAAAESGITIANLKVLVHRAMKTLRSRIANDHDD